MEKLNWGRLVIGGLVAAVILFLTDGFFHEKVVNADWNAVYAGLGSTPPQQHGGMGLTYFLIFEIGRGLTALFLYATSRAHFRPGPKTATLAAVVMWFAFSLTGPAQFIPLGFYSHALWIKVGAFQLATSIIATIAGASLYKDK